MVNIILYCQGCEESFEGMYDKKGKIISTHLSKHLHSKNSFWCKTIYQTKGLIQNIIIKRGEKINFDFSTSTRKKKLSPEEQEEKIRK